MSPSILSFLSSYDEKERSGQGFGRPKDSTPAFTGSSEFSCANFFSFSQSCKHHLNDSEVSLTGKFSHQTLTIIMPFLHAALLCL